MRVLVFAHVPPPFHGQSYMVKLMLDNFQKTSADDNERTTLFHVNAQLSDATEDIGSWRFGKIFRLIGYIFQARWMRWKYSLDAFYYIPAPPGKRGALYRDWLVLCLAAPFFKNKIFHWQAAGLGVAMAEGEAQGRFSWADWITRALYSSHELSICLSNHAREDAIYFKARKIAVVPNGIPDPCPDFDLDIWPQRQQRAKELGTALSPQAKTTLIYEVLFLAACMTEKGLLDALDAVIRANQLLQKKNLPLRMRLTVAGAFSGEAERACYESRARQLNAIQHSGDTDPLAVFVGWADEEKKKRLYQKADCFIFPTTYSAESFGVVLIEAMAFGCSIITTKWRGLPEVLPANYPYLVEPHDIEAMVNALMACASQPSDHSLRDHFMAHFANEIFTRNMQSAFSEVEVEGGA